MKFGFGFSLFYLVKTLNYVIFPKNNLLFHYLITHFIQFHKSNYFYMNNMKYIMAIMLYNNNLVDIRIVTLLAKYRVKTVSPNSSKT